jgi:hypothetical protein
MVRFHAKQVMKEAAILHPRRKGKGKLCNHVSLHQRCFKRLSAVSVITGPLGNMFYGREDVKEEAAALQGS